MPQPLSTFTSVLQNSTKILIQMKYLLEQKDITMQLHVPTKQMLLQRVNMHKTVKIIISVLVVAIAIFSNGNKESKNVETKDTNAEVETVKVDERKELQEKSKTILD